MYEPMKLRALREVKRAVGGGAHLARLLGIKPSQISSWLNRGVSIRLEFAVLIVDIYATHGYRFKFLYNENPMEETIQNNTVYVYVSEGRLMYALIDLVSDQIVRIEITAEQWGEDFHSIQSIAEDTLQQKMFTKGQIARFFMLLSKRGYYRKDNLEFTCYDLAPEAARVPLHTLYRILDEGKKQLSRISVRALKAREYAYSLGDGRWRKCKNAERPVGRLLDWVARKFGFSSREILVSAWVVVDFGCPELTSAMDHQWIKVSRAEKMTSWPLEERRLFIEQLRAVKKNDLVVRWMKQLGRGYQFLFDVCFRFQISPYSVCKEF